MRESDMVNLGYGIPPQALNEEQAVLGCCMIDPTRGSVDACRCVLKAGDFYRPLNAAIYNAILRLDEENRPVDVVTVEGELQKCRDYHEGGGRHYLLACNDSVPAVSRCSVYATEIARASYLRHLIDVGGRMVGKAWSADADPATVTAWAQGELFALEQHGLREEPVHIEGVMSEVMCHIEEARETGKRLQGVTTGFIGLDRETSGLQRSELTLVAGRPSMGKTAFALSTTLAAARAGTGVLVWSLEMSRKSLGFRLLSATAEIDGLRVKSGDLLSDSHNGDEWVRAVESAGEIAGLPIWIDQRADRTLEEIRAMSRRFRQTKDVGLIVIDYVGLMVRDAKPEYMRHEYARISIGMKALAKELEIPILLLAQLNRDTERRQDKRPLLSNLAECAALEADADVVLFPFRPAVYDKSRPLPEREDAEIIVGKNRNGPQCSVPVKFVNRFSYFVE